MTSEAVTTAIAIRDETSAVILTNAQLTMIANTSFVPAAFRGKVPEVLACVATGRALGVPDMTSLRGIHVIEGKATLSAELMVAIVRGHGHSISGQVDDKKAVVKGRRVDNGDEMEATFTFEMAEKAGLVGKSNWKKHPDDMMWARAVSRLCRRLFADCFAGSSYVPEEVEATADELMDESVPFDSGVLPDSEDAAALADGGLTEPGVLVPPPEKERGPVSDPGPASGSASPWAQLSKLAMDAGLLAELKAAGKAMFPGRRPSELSMDECAELWAAVEAGAKVEA
jgi:hypothetical protein